jgi:hypothetical protein
MARVVSGFSLWCLAMEIGRGEGIGASVTTSRTQAVSSLKRLI